MKRLWWYWFRDAIARAWQSMPLNRRDGLFILGAAALINGAANVYSPAGWIVAGVVLLAVWAQPYLMRRNS